MEEQKNIVEFKAGDTILGVYLTKTVDYKVGSNNSRYVDFTFGDKTGEINAKLWDYSDKGEPLYKENQLIKLKASVNEWQGRIQLKVEKIRVASEEDGYRIEDFVQSAPFPAEDMYAVIEAFIEKIKDKRIRDIVEIIINDNKEKLMYYPAAKKNHHAVRCGLLYHISTMLKTAEKLSEVYPVNTDFLYAGVILHDIGKLTEMATNEIGIITSYTLEGNLLGHLIKGVKVVSDAADKANAGEEISLLLQHMILSHHYKPEFGSPVAPRIPEAELLHYIDLLDSHMYDINRVLESTEQGDFSEKIWTLDNRQMYKYIAE